MQLTLYATRRAPHGASRLVLAMSAWSVKNRRAPSWHCRDAKVYGRTTTAMHNVHPRAPRRRAKYFFVGNIYMLPESMCTVEGKDAEFLYLQRDARR